MLFEQPGELTLEHRTPDRTYRLATIAVGEERAEPSLAEPFEILRGDPELSAERERLAPWLEAEPDKTLAFVAEMDFEAAGRPRRLRLPDAPRGRLPRSRAAARSAA